MATLPVGGMDTRLSDAFLGGSHCSVRVCAKPESFSSKMHIGDYNFPLHAVVNSERTLRAFCFTMRDGSLYQ